MSLISTTEVRARISTDFADQPLQAMIDQEEAEITRRYGPHSDGVVTTVVERTIGSRGRGSALVNLESGRTFLGRDSISTVFTRRPIAAVVTVKESSNGFVSSTTLAANQYRLLDEIAGVVERISSGVGVGFLSDVEVSYIPEDDTMERKRVLMELVRVATDRTAMRAESVGGEYSYKTPDDWETEREKLLTRLAHDSYC
jgi:hypothetical protein